MSLDDRRSSTREGIAARIEALEAARRALSGDRAEAAASIRRLAQSLATVRGFVPEIAAAVQKVEKADDHDVEVAARELIGALQRATLRVAARASVILIVEDDRDIAEVLSERLAGPGREVVVAGSVADAERALDEHQVSVLLLDLGLPDADGRDVLLRIRARPAGRDVPVIVVTAKGGDVPRTECLALGVDAYFEKPFEPRSVAAAVAVLLERSIELALHSRLDPLTGLLDRAGLQEAYARAVARSPGGEEPLSIVLLDLDSFKAINDRHGHAMGDEVLRRTARVLERALRRSDVVARWGGEEFVALLYADAGRAVDVMERALGALRAESFETADGSRIRVTFSAGVTAVSPAASLEHVVAEADRLLYLAKAAGKDRVLAASP